MKLVKFTFSLFEINTYVTVDTATRKCAVIDPGMINAEEEAALANFVKKNNLEVTHIINTHLHVDHAIGDKYAKDLFQVPVLGHKADTVLGERLQEQAWQFGMREKVDAVSMTSYLEDGDVVKIGEGELHVLHVPGHSPGSIALYDKEGDYVISGDALFYRSIGRTDLPGGDHDTLVNAVKDKLLTLPPDTVVYPGHGPATTIGDETKFNPYL